MEETEELSGIIAKMGDIYGSSCVTLPEVLSIGADNELQYNTICYGWWWWGWHCSALYHKYPQNRDLTVFSWNQGWRKSWQSQKTLSSGDIHIWYLLSKFDIYSSNMTIEWSSNNFVQVVGLGRMATDCWTTNKVDYQSRLRCAPATDNLSSSIMLKMLDDLWP